MRLFIFLGVLAVSAFTPFHQTYAQVKDKTPPFELGKGLALLNALGFQIEEPTPEEARKISRTLADNYYKSCMETPSTLFQDVDIYETCGCATGNMLQIMTVDEILEMFKDTEEGLFQRQRFLNVGYMPCTEHALFKLVKYKCMADKNMRKGLQYAEPVCICLAREVSEQVSAMSSNRLHREKIDPADDPDIQAMFTQYLTGPAYDSLSRKSFKHCLRRYEHRWPGD